MEVPLSTLTGLLQNENLKVNSEDQVLEIVVRYIELRNKC